MQLESPVLDMRAQTISTCNEILREKINMITAALALQGKVRRSTGYDPLTSTLTQLAILSRKMNNDDFDAMAWRKAIEAADDIWWEWYDKRPNNLAVPTSAMNYTPRRDDRLALREELRQKYSTEAERVGV